MAVTINRGGIKTLTGGPIREAVVQIARRVQKVARQIAPDDTGKLKRSINIGAIKIRGYHVRATVETSSGYGLFVEEGTGIYGPSGKRIFPKRKPFLVFQPRGSRNLIRVRSVKGQPGQHYMREALIAVIATL